MNIQSTLIHGGSTSDATTGAVNVPIYLSSTFKQQGLGEAGEYEYARSGNPTRAALERLISELEAGHSSYAFASGMAAISAVLMLFNSGDKILLSDNVYGGTFRILDKIFQRFKLNYELVDSSNLAAVAARITPEVKALFIETPTNPLMSISDIRGLSQLAKQAGILTIVDNTFMTPYLQQPLTLGADIVVHSATKYLAGHSDLIAGLAIVANAKLAGELQFIQNASGGVLAPFDSWLLIRGIKTLAVRLDRQQENTRHISNFLGRHPAIGKLFYPGLSQHPGFTTHQQQARGNGAMLSFELTEGYNLQRFFKALNLITLAESLGGVESLISHPASMTHAAIPAEIRAQVGISERLIRLSVGIENVHDLVGDLSNALNSARVA